MFPYLLHTVLSPSLSVASQCIVSPPPFTGLRTLSVLKLGLLLASMTPLLPYLKGAITGHSFARRFYQTLNAGPPQG